ncbi:MAG: M14 family metallocarboxypeptidase [Candidatus Woesearchaeota archaeon]
MNAMRKRSYRDEIVTRLSNLDSRLKASILGYVGSKSSIYPIYNVNTGSDIGAPKILLSAGVHGDEPAGVYALLDFLEGPILKYASAYDFLVLPCLNPWGFEHDDRRNMYGVDINRSFVKNTSAIAILLKEYISRGKEYLFAMNLHEDDTYVEVGGFPKEDNPRGFYVYEESLGGLTIGRSMIMDLQKNGIEICRNASIYGDMNKEGVIFSKSNSGEFEQFLERYTKKVLVPETPTCWSLEKRIAAQKIALHSALDFGRVDVAQVLSNMDYIKQSI